MTLPKVPIVDGLLAFECPRCHERVGERHYGPCEACRSQLRDTLGASSGVDGKAWTGEAWTGEDRPHFEPKMHVVPNHVATKDD